MSHQSKKSLGKGLDSNSFAKAQNVSVKVVRLGEGAANIH